MNRTSRARLGAVMAAALSLALSACRQGSAHTGGEPPAPAVSMAVSMATAKRAPMSDVARLLGTTVALRRVTIKSPAAGRVTELTLQSGDTVRKGQIVARIVTREDDAARAGLNIAGQLDSETAATMNRAVERYARGGIAVLAPSNAIVAQRQASDDQVVAEFDPILDVIDPGSIYVEAAAPIDVLRLIKPGMPATVTSALEPGVEYACTVAAILPSFSLQGVTSPVRLAFVGQKRIRQVGATVEALVTIRDVPDALEVPSEAIFQDPERGTFYVFAVGNDGLAHRTTVAVGIHNSSNVQILSGLSEGQTVITSGGYALSDGLAVRPVASQTPAAP